MNSSTPFAALSETFLSTFKLDNQFLAALQQIPPVVAALDLHVLPTGAKAPRVRGTLEIEKALALTRLLGRARSKILAKVNAAQSHYYNLPDAIHLYILQLLFNMSQPAIPVACQENLGWLPTTQICTKLRNIAIRHPQLWVDVACHLPLGASTLKARARPLGVIMRIDQRVPKLRDKIQTGTLVDRGRILALFESINPEEVSIIQFTEDRVSIPQAMTWLRRGTAWTNTLPLLGGLRIHAPNQLLDKEKDVADVPALNDPSAVPPIGTPRLRIYDVVNCFVAVEASSLVMLHSTYDSTPTPRAAKGSLSNFMSMLEDNHSSVQDVVLRNSFHPTIRPADRPLATFVPHIYQHLRYLHITSTADLATECLSRIRWNDQAEVSLSLLLKLDPAAARQDLNRLFEVILQNDAHPANRALYIRRARPRLGAVKTYALWTWDPIPETVSFPDYIGPARRPGTVTIAFQSYALFPWTEFIGAFGVATGQHPGRPPLKTLCIMAEDAAWNIPPPLLRNALEMVQVPEELYPPENSPLAAVATRSYSKS